MLYQELLTGGGCCAHVQSASLIKGRLHEEMTIKPNRDPTPVLSTHPQHHQLFDRTSQNKMKESLGNSNVKSTAPNNKTNNSSTGNNNRLCVTVLGSTAVGKTALTVQYLTSRFIGDYFSGTDMTYHHSFAYMGGSLKTNVDILDISRPSSNDVIGEDEEMLSSLVGTEKSVAYLVVYSLTNSKSFDRARDILSRLPFHSPKYLVANQLDLQHRRQVSRLEGQTVADEFGCLFDEFSAAEPNYEGQQWGVKIVFQKLIRQLISNSHVLPYPRMIRFSSFSKMIGAIVSKTRHHSANSNNKLQQQQQKNLLASHNNHQHNNIHRKSSMSSGSDRSSNSSGNNSTGSVDSIATLTPDMSLLHINSAHLIHGVKSKPIPIVHRKLVTSSNYPSTQIASI